MARHVVHPVTGSNPSRYDVQAVASNSTDAALIVWALDEWDANH